MRHGTAALLWLVGILLFIGGLTTGRWIYSTPSGIRRDPIHFRRGPDGLVAAFDVNRSCFVSGPIPGTEALQPGQLMPCLRQAEVPE